jgi:hypothetical protein
MDVKPIQRRRWTWTRYRRGGCGCGCSGFFVVLTLGIVLSLFNAGVGIGVSLRIPFTQSNVTVAGALGAKSKTADALPSYTAGRLGGNQNFFNNSTTMTIGPAEGAALVVIGRQDDAPAVDLHLVVR